MTRLARWRVEVALRMDDLVRARGAFGEWEGWGIKRDVRERAWLFGAMAEVEVRMGRWEEASARLEQARWEGGDSWRLRVTQCLGEVGRGREGNLQAQDVAQVRQVLPGMLAELGVALGQEIEGMQERADARSRWVLEQDTKEES